MPADGRADGGNVVVKGSSVMDETRRRFARERHVTRGRMDQLRKADDGRSNGILFPGIAGVVMQQVVLCSNWCASTGKPESTISNARTRSVMSSTGKRSAGKLACCVWRGGKAARPYLSLLFGLFWQIYKKNSRNNLQCFTLMKGHEGFSGLFSQICQKNLYSNFNFLLHFSQQ
jgi:hypothetical protein